ncbi:MAG: GNAT family N-acetyltransferase [Lactobacillus sp.]
MSNKEFILYPIGVCPDFENLSQNFDSTNEGIDDFFRKNCLKYEKNQKLRTFVLVDVNNSNKIVGFFSSTVGLLSQSIKKDDGTYKVDRPYINLAYFAIDRNYQGQGIGRALMMEFFSMCMVIGLYTGVQLIYLESVCESVSFYKKLGYQLVDERKSPEKYEEYGNDPSNWDYPMLMKISSLTDNGHKPYSTNMLPKSI